MNTQTFAGRSAGLAKLALLCLAGWMTNAALAQPTNDNFADAIIISGAGGTIGGSNVNATLETCEASTIYVNDYAQTEPVGASVWYAWTAQASGTVSFNTVGSGFDTVLSVWTTANGLCDASLTNLVADDDSGGNSTSALAFSAVAGTTYYICVEGYDYVPPATGTIVLNWNEVPTAVPAIASGTFRFASGQTVRGVPGYVVSESDSSSPGDTSVSPSVYGARVTVTRDGGSSGRVFVDYTVIGSTYTNILRTNIFGVIVTYGFIDTNLNIFQTNYVTRTVLATNSYQYHDAGYQYYSTTNATTNFTTSIYFNGGLVSVLSGSGPSTVPTNAPSLNLTTNIIYFPGGSTNTVINADGSVSITISNIFQLPSVVTNQIVPSGSGIQPVSGTLTFDDFQMSQDIFIPVNPAVGPDAVLPNIPSLARVTLSNPRLDAQESADLLPPAVAVNGSNAWINALNPNFAPGPGVFNFERSNFRVNENVVGGNAVIYVTRTGGDPKDAVSVSYRIDFLPASRPDNNNLFPLQAGSDYATPNVDYTSVTGTLSWGPGDFNPKSFSVPILNDNLAEFNEDMLLQFYNALPVPNGTDPGMVVGEVGTATLTILDDDQPAGAADRTWNQNDVSGSNPPYINYPGTTGNGGTVYAVAEQPDGMAIIAGSFNSFDQNAYNGIVRVLPDGYPDPAFQGNFSPWYNSGANDFIAALALQPDGKIIIAGNFTSFNGNNRHHIARLNSDGTLDTTFNPGLGADGMVWSVALQPNGQMIIGGDFGSVNNVNLAHVARLNADGSVDTSFNPGVGPDGTVNAVAVDGLGRVIIGGDFDAVSGADSGGVARLNVDGSLDASFAPGIGTFNPFTLATDPVYALAVQPDGQILIAGGFSYLDLVGYNGIARLNTDGTVDLSFNPGMGTFNPATGVSDTIYAMRLQPDGEILIGGDFTTYNQTRRVGVARLFADGDLDTSFMDTAYNQFAGLINNYHNPNAVNNSIYPAANERNFVYALAQESGGNVIIGGGFLAVGGSCNWSEIYTGVPQSDDGYGHARDAVIPRSNVARLIGGVTPGPGNIAFIYGNYSASKPNNGVSANNLFISLMRTNGNLGIIGAAFSTNTAAPGPGIAVPGVDFTLSPAYTRPTYTTTWPYVSDPTFWGWMYDNGEYGPNYATSPYGAVVPVYVTIYNDGLITGNLNANLTLSSPFGSFSLGGEVIPLGAALGGQATAPLTIIDDNYNAGVLGFSSPNFTVLESQGYATITVVRTNGAQNVVQVNYTTSNGTATNGMDYTNVTGTLTFNVGETNKTFTVPIINGTTIQPDKTVNLTLYSPSGGAQLGLANAVLTIINGNFSNGHISFTATNFNASENSGTALVTVSRLGGSVGTINVTLLTSGGSAVPGVDYLAYSNTLTWNNKLAFTTNVAIPVFHNALVTSNRTVNLWLTNLTLNTFPTNACWGLITNSALTINNVDSAGTVEFSSPIYSVKKSGGFALVPVVRAGGSVGTVTVDYFTQDGSALSNVNYTATGGTLTFTDGQIGQFIQVPVIDNGASNGLTSLTLVLSNAQPAYALGGPSNATLNIIDTDSVNEPPGSGDVTYDTLGLNGTVYALALQPNNQLVAGGDFTMANGVPRQRIARFNSDGSVDSEFSLPSSAYGANDSVRAIAVQTDGRILVGGFFTNFNSVVLNHIARLNSDGSLDSQFTPGSGPDNAVYALAQTFVGGQSKILVGGAFATIGGTPINAIARLNADGSLDTTFNPGLGANGAVYALAVQGDGKVVIGGDFTAVNGNTNFNHIARLNTDGSVDGAFNPGTGASGSVHAIAIQLDGRILIGGYFTNVNGTVLNHIARLNTDGSVDGAFQPGVGANDAVFCIALQSNTRIVLGGEFTSCSGVTRNRITRLNPDGSVDPTINFGTGANNFVAAVVVQEDTIFGYPTNVSDEKIIIGGGFTRYNGQPHAYLARIYGGSISGSGEFEFSSSDYYADENSTNAIITILRQFGTTGDVLVPFYTSDGSAVADIDHAGVTNYIYVTNNIDFPQGEVIRTVAVPVLDDGIITSNLTVNLAVNPTNTAQVGSQPRATLHILNDDSAVSFSAATYTVAKNAINGAATINIVRQGSVSGTSTVLFSTTATGTATPGLDYYPTNVFVTFPPGVSNVLVTVGITNNGIAEGNQTVGLQLSDATGSLLYSPSNAVLTIVDTVYSPGQLSFSATNYVITASGVGYTNAYITVLRTFGSLGAVSASFSTMDGTAVAGVKYISTNGVVSFGDGETTPKTFAVQVINTTNAEGPEYLNLVLTNATGGVALAAPTNATLTILNTNTGVAFVLATNSFSEDGGIVFEGTPDTVFISVVRFNNTNVTTTVSYATTDGTATNGVNYVGTTNTLTFNPGDSVLTVPIALIHDPNVTGPLTFTLHLFNPTGGAQLTAPSTTVIRELDAEAGLSFTTNAATVLKTDGYVLLPVISSNPDVGPVSVNYATGGGTAAPGVDYTPESGTLLFTNGQAFNYILVPIIPNSLVQGNKTFNVTLSGAVSPGVLVPPTTVTVTIIETNTPPGLNFYSPITMNDDWGSTNVDNNTVFGGLAWFAWTPTNSGEVEFDTIGSVDDAAGITNLSTAMGVFTGTNMNNLNTVVINTGIYPDTQQNYSAQNLFSLYPTNSFLPDGNVLPVVETLSSSYLQNIGGPSLVRFNAVAGQTYYIAVETYSSLLSDIETGNGNSPLLTINDVISPPAGLIKLNWALHPSGVFRFAQEDLDMTGLTYSNGLPMLLYRVSETEESRRPTGTVDVDRYNSTLDGTIAPSGHWSYDFDVPGLLVTVTRVAGSSGRVQVGYTTEDITPGSSLLGPNGYLLNGDLPAVSTYNFVGTNVILRTPDYVPVSGVLTFDDSEMSKTIFVPIQDDGGLPQQNRDFLIVLTNAALDRAESPHVQSPRLDNTYSTALVRILDADISPQGPSSISTLVTNINPITLVTNVMTNIVWNIQPTNSVFNFAKAHYQVTRDASVYWGGTPITLYVNRMGTNSGAETIHWRVNNYYLDRVSSDLVNGEFPLQPGSDYATPTPPDNTGIRGLVPDFNFSGGYSGTPLSFPSGNGAFDPQPISFTIATNGLQQFNEDFTVSLYFQDSKNVDHPVGMIDQTTVTILFDDNHPPAGSVDEFYNADFSYDMTGPFQTQPAQMSHPGADGEVRGLVVQPDDKTVIVGDFSSYDLSSRKRIARINTDGSLDTTFNPGYGLNNFAACVALTGTDQLLIGGAFSSYNGVLRKGIARVNADGTLDTSFNPGDGANGPVWAVMPLLSGKIMIGGGFTSYNGVERNYVARLNPDGTLDDTFDPGTNINATVYAMTPSSRNINVNRAASGAELEDVNPVNVGAPSGILTVEWDFESVPDDMKVFYGDTNTVRGTGVLIYDTGLTNNLWNPVTGWYVYVTNTIPFGPTNGLTANYITIVMNQGNGTPGTLWDYTAQVAVGGDQIVVGGDFTSAGGIAGQDHIARLNGDGTLDPTFDPGSGANAAVFALATQPDGNIVVGGEFSRMNGQPAGNIARLTTGGFTDPDFYSGVGADGPVYSLTVNTSPIYWTTNTVASTNSSVAAQTNFTVYVGGAFTAYNGTHRLGFARLNADGTLDTTFLDTAYNQFAGLPRDRYSDPLGRVLVSALQSDGAVMIGGSFSRVGGGQSDDVEVRPESIDTNNVSLIESYYTPVQKTRAGIRNRSNVARLVGGATPGPGNIGLLNSSYSINKSQTPLFVSLVRNNGTLGPASANFAVQPGLAQSGVDYFYENVDPLYWIAWELGSPYGRMHSDGLWGTNGLTLDVYGRTWGNGQSFLTMDIFDNTNNLSDLSAQFQLTAPVGADQWYLGGEDIPLGVALGRSVAPLTLIDDHHVSGTFGFAAPSYTGTGNSAAISVTRTNGNYGVVYLSYATSTNGSTAILNSDYTAASGTMTFQPSDTSKTFTVPILNSNWTSSAEKTVNLTLFGLNPPVNGLASWGLTNAVLRIINPNFAGFLSLSTNAYYANLSAGAVAVTVTRTVGSQGTLTVQFATTNGTAVSGVDYAGVTNVLQWNNGDVAPKTITIPLLNNGAVGGAKRFGVRVSNPALNGVSNAALFAANSVTLAAVFVNNDNSYGSFQFSAPGYVVNENGGYATLTVIRTGGTNGTASVVAFTTNATALAGVNYLPTVVTNTFVPGQFAASFQVAITNDHVADPPPGAFYFTVSLANPSTGASLGSPAAANVSIVDAQSYNRPPGSLDTTFNLGSGMNGDVFALALQSSGQILVGGNFTAVSGVPENYLARLNTDGSLDRSGFLYGLSGASRAVYAVANQTDDQILVGGAFTNFDGTILNHIARLNTDGSLDSSFDPGAGANNTVYALAETFLRGARKIYAAGAFGTMNGSATPFVARLNNDGTVDPSFATGSGPNATVYAVAVYSTNSPFAGKVLIGGEFTNVNNATVGHVARLNADGSLDMGFDSNLAVGAGDIVRTIAIQSDGKVLIGGDFTNVNGVAANHIARLNTDGSLDTSFTAPPASAGANGPVSTIAIQADNRIVVVGQFTLASGVTRNHITRLLPTGAVDPTINFGDGANGAVDAAVIQPADQMIVIGGAFTQYDGQPAGHVARIYGGSATGSGAFTFTSAAYQVDENGLQALIGIRRVGGTSGTNADGSGNVSVTFATADGTAKNHVNYLGTTNRVVFPLAEVLRYVAVPVMDDSNITPNLTVNLSLTNATPPAGLGDQSSAVLTIINDDNSVSFGSATYSVPKDILTGYGTIDVARLGSVSGSCTVDLLTTTNGTAVPGVDFQPTNLTVVFNPGVTDVVVRVPILYNTNYTGDRTVVFALTNAVSTFLSSPSNATLTITETVNSAGQLSFAATNFDANASDGIGYLTVTRAHGLSGGVSANYNIVPIPNSALFGVNYKEPTNGTVSFGPGQSNATISVNLYNNTLAEGPVSLSVVLSTNQNGSGTATLIPPTNATLTIYNTNIVVTFTAATNTFSEADGDVFISVVRFNNTNVTTSVDYATVDGTAHAGANYQPASGTLMFYPGQSLVTIPVSLIHDTNATGTLTFTMNLSNPTGGAQLASPSTTLIQELDAEAGLSFMTNAVSVPKDIGSVLVSVVCANPAVEPVIVDSNTVPLSVDYSTADGTAVAGQDYVATSGTLIFTNRIGTNTFAVPIINNTLVNGNRSLTVNLSNPTLPGQLVPPSSQTVTIIDNNSGLSFSSPTYTVLRSNLTATITVLRTDNTNITSSVNFATADGTATAGNDYEATSGTMVFTNGVTSRTFPVAVIPSATVQPDKTVLLQLSGPTNGILIAPSASVLTIHDTSGSYVVPAGSTLIWETNAGPANGIIDSNETVTLLFAFRDAGGNNVDDLKAALLATNGVTAPAPATQDYGPLTYSSHSVSRPFSFTAHGTNGQLLAATFLLTNNTTGIGKAIFTYTVGSWTVTYSNTAPIIINDDAIATPYPSTINVSGLSATVLKTSVTWTNVSHTAPADIDALLVAPNQFDTLIMAHAGGENAITHVTLTFNDATNNPSLPQFDQITNGVYKPTGYLPVPSFP